MLEATIILALLGLAMGSFLNALVWRIRKKKDWVKGRSQCDHCNHQLVAADLVPVLSWLVLKGRCRYCKKAISWQHPAVELVTGLVFAVSYHFWPGGLHTTGPWILFITWLVVSIGLLALAVYDLKWMLLPSRILYPTLAMALSGRLIYLVGYAPHKLHSLVLWLLSVAVASGIFWLLFMLSRGAWIGYGDVRLGLITGTILGKPSLSLLMIFTASVLGTLFAAPALFSGRKKLASKLPYGPFLIAATGICLLWGDQVIHWYHSAFLI